MSNVGSLENARFLYHEKLKATRRLIEAEADYDAVNASYLGSDGGKSLTRQDRVLALQRASRDPLFIDALAHCRYFLDRTIAMSSAFLAEVAYLTHPALAPDDLVKRT